MSDEMRYVEWSMSDRSGWVERGATLINLLGLNLVFVPRETSYTFLSAVSIDVESMQFSVDVVCVTLAAAKIGDVTEFVTNQINPAVACVCDGWMRDEIEHDPDGRDERLMTILSMKDAEMSSIPNQWATMSAYYLLGCAGAWHEKGFPAWVDIITFQSHVQTAKLVISRSLHHQNVAVERMYTYVDGLREEIGLSIEVETK